MTLFALLMLYYIVSFGRWDLRLYQRVELR